MTVLWRSCHLSLGKHTGDLLQAIYHERFAIGDLIMWYKAYATKVVSWSDLDI